MKKICVYTCITGNYDNLKEIKDKEEGIDYYCFTNNKKIKSDTWDIIYIEDKSLSNVKLARKIKILGHKKINDNYDILLWMDAAVTFNKKIKDFIKTYYPENCVLAAFKHGDRNNILEECKAVVQGRKETKENIKKLLEFYKRENYNFDNGLIESTVYIKKPKDKKVKQTMELWFSMIKDYSKRDQLSFNYCIKKTGLKVNWINEKVFSNDWFNWESHINDATIKSYRVYFDAQEKYTLENDFQGELKEKENNKYSIEIVPPIDCRKTVIELPKISFIYVDNIKINGKNLDKDKSNMFNAIEYKNGYIFYNINPAFEFYKKVAKGKKITIELEIIKLTEKEIKKVFEEVILQQKQIIERYKSENSNLNQKNEELKIRNKQLKFEINKIINTKTWKLLTKIRNIIKK